MPRLATKEECVGCTACVNACPHGCLKMEADCDGFAYPVLIDPAACMDCGRCEKVCPIFHEQAEDRVEPLAYAAFSKNETRRMESSSGGLFSELAGQILAQGGAVFGAVYDDEFRVRHQCIVKEGDLWRLRGAKYAESSLGNTFSDVRERLKRGQNVLFSGTPCQVAGLQSFLGKDYENLYSVDFICHGVPAPLAWKAYVAYRGQKDADGDMPESINMRSKETGWSHYQYCNVFAYKNGTRRRILSSDSLFMKLFVGNYLSRASCGTCKFKGYRRCSDITLGDFWGIWDYIPQMDDHKGTSVVFIQSEKGQKLWDALRDQIVFQRVPLEQTSRQNPSVLVPSKAHCKCKEVLEQIRDGQIAQCENLFCEPKPSLVGRIRGKIQKLLPERETMGKKYKTEKKDECDK